MRFTAWGWIGGGGDFTKTVSILGLMMELWLVVGLVACVEEEGNQVSILGLGLH